MKIAGQTGAYVTDAADLDVVIDVERADERGELAELGFMEPTIGTLKRTSSNMEDKAKTLCLLRDLGVAFSADPGWSPSEVFEELRDRGMLEGVYRRISWLAPGEWRIEENC